MTRFEFQFFPYSWTAAYVDKRAIDGLWQHIERGTLTELSGKGADGGFPAILRQAKLSGAAEPTSWGGAWEQVFLVIKTLRACGNPKYFESLDQAFVSAPEAEDGCVWVLAQEKFTLTNAVYPHLRLWDTRLNPFSAKLMNEQRLVFEIDPIRSSYVEGDDYFKRPKRPWRLMMVASFSRNPRSRFGRSIYEQVYFSWHRNTDIPLNVFGAYLKSGLQTTIIPYAIWAPRFSIREVFGQCAVECAFR